MSNPWPEYYANQAGSGLTGFQGYKFQRGHGFFGDVWNFIKPIVKPIGRYLGRNLLSTGVSIGGDLLNGENIKESASKRFKSMAKDLLNDGADRVKKFAQTGNGKRRRRKRKSKQNHTKLNVKPKKSKKKKPKKKRRTVKRKSSKSKGLRHLF